MNLQSELVFIFVYLILSFVSYREFVKAGHTHHATLLLAVIWSIFSLISICTVIFLLTLLVFPAFQFSWSVIIKMIVASFIAATSTRIAIYFKNTLV